MNEKPRKNGNFDGNLVKMEKKLLFLINPVSGRSKAYNIFREKVVPILAENGTKYEVLITKAQNDVFNFVKSSSLLHQWNGFVVVSGDGLLYELFNGLMARDDWQQAIKLPVGIIPGGSGNGLAAAINYAIGFVKFI